MRIRFIQLFILMSVCLGTNALGQVKISIPDSTISEHDEEILYPIKMSDLEGDSVLAYHLEIEFDPEIIEINSFSNASTLTSSFTTVSNNESENMITVSAAGANPIKTDGILVYLVITPISDGSSSLTFKEVVLNEGKPEVSSVNGNLELQVFTSNEERSKNIHNFKLEQNYPNPFNPSTKIGYQLPKPSPVIFKVYDSMGRMVFSKNYAYKSLGNHSLSFNGTNLPSGVYFYQISFDAKVVTKQMMLIK